MAPVKSKLVILGAGTEAAWVIDTLSVLGEQGGPPYEIIGLVDLTDRGNLKGTAIEGYKVLGTIDELMRIAEGAQFHVAATRDNRARAGAARRAEVCGLYPIKVLHPRATLARSAQIESGVILHPGTVVGPRAVIRAGTVMSTHSTVDGFATVGPFAHLDIGCRISSRCTVEAYVTIGTGSIILPKVKVGRGAVIAPGTVVARDVEEYTVVSGSPPKVIDRLPRPKEPGTSIYEQSGQAQRESGVIKGPPDSSPNVVDDPVSAPPEDAD